MYRSYSVNDMPQPIRYYDGGENRSRPQQSHGGGSSGAGHSDGHSNVHTDNAAAQRERHEPCPPPQEHECQQQGVIPAQDCPPVHNLPRNCPAQNCPPRGAKPNNNGGLLAGLKNDDLILLAVVVILLMDGCDDKLLLAALGLVFFSDYFGL